MQQSLINFFSPRLHPSSTARLTDYFILRKRYPWWLRKTSRESLYVHYKTSGVRKLTEGCYERIFILMLILHKCNILRYIA